MGNKPETTAIILAGGKSSRMGTDKRLLPLQGRPVFDIVLESVKPFFDEIIISTNDPETLSHHGFECVEDEVIGAGPAAGIMSVMRRHPREYYQVVACDTPFVEGAAALRVLELAQDADAAIVRTPDGLPQALFSAYSIRCLPAFEDSISKGSYRILHCIRNLNIRNITVDQIGLQANWERHFFNINTPPDLSAAKNILMEQ
jgi:molybdenum cofactor guanylyltransferase